MWRVMDVSRRPNDVGGSATTDRDGVGGAGCSGDDDDVSSLLVSAALLCGDDRRDGVGGAGSSGDDDDVSFLLVSAALLCGDNIW